MMRTSINRMDAFIGEITDYARNAHTEVAIEPLDIEQLIRECFQDLHYLPRAAPSGKIFMRRCPDRCTPTAAA